MTLVLSILFFVVGIGLFARRLTPAVWWAVGVWIVLMMAVQYIRG